jgi:crotonobetainyl-CoA:carnitine CoA-transferase CaiB-like acyl-CoA transferase
MLVRTNFSAQCARRGQILLMNQPTEEPGYVLPPAQGPLKDIKVLDLGIMLAGPLVGCYLGDMGADVVKIERPGGDPARMNGRNVKGVSLTWKALGRNKRSVELDFTKEEGRALLLDLVKSADIVIENFRAGTLEKWRLGWDDLRAANPRVIFVRISGFGQDGPYSARPGFGTIAESMVGFTAVNGDAGGPPILPPVPLADTAAAMSATMAALAALHRRDVSGEGELIDVSLLEPLFGYFGPQLMEYSVLGVEPKRLGNRLDFASPRGAYLAGDGRWFAISGATQSTAEKIFEAIGHSEIKLDPRLATNAARIENADLVDELIQKWASTQTREQALAKLERTGAPVGPINTMADIVEDPHFKARNVYTSVADPELGSVLSPNVFARLTNNPGAVRFAGRPLDADRDAVLREWIDAR